MTKITLDEAQDAFRKAPSRKTARVYLAIAKQYWTDEMVGTATLDAAITEVSRRGYPGLEMLKGDAR